MRLLGIISLIGLYELYRVFKIEKSLPALFGYIASVVFYLNLGFHFIPDIMLFVMALLILCMCSFVFCYPKYHANQIMLHFSAYFMCL